MKRTLILAAIAILSAVGANANESNALEQKAKVYICTGTSATTYHKLKSCRGLSSCKSSIKEITVEEAVAMKRRPCKLCCQ